MINGRHKDNVDVVHKLVRFFWAEKLGGGNFLQHSEIFPHAANDCSHSWPKDWKAKYHRNYFKNVD